MKKISIVIFLVVTLIFTGCIKDDDTPIINIQENTSEGINKTGMINSNETWTKNNIYILNQKVVVTEGVTLTIEEGTIIKGSSGNGSLASALIIARGGKLNAVGTPDEPIIFTSTSDNIKVGETAGTNLNETNNGLWGGLLILGYAPCSFSGDIQNFQIEGIPANDTFGLYGGTNPADSSGILQYVSIRHGGALIGEGNEINGLTLGGVGSGTVIDNIEVAANVDDGIEFFGGTVNASNLLVWAQGDDGLDIDQAYSGTISNAVVVLGKDSDHALEIDGPEGTANGSYRLENLTLIGNLETNDGEYADFRKGATGANNNIFAYGFKADADVELDADADAINYNNNTLTFDNWEIVLPESVENIQDVFVNKATVNVNGFGSEAIKVNTGSQTVGADTSNLNWTYANFKAELNF